MSRLLPFHPQVQVTSCSRCWYRSIKCLKGSGGASLGVERRQTDELDVVTRLRPLSMRPEVALVGQLMTIRPPLRKRLIPSWDLPKAGPSVVTCVPVLSSSIVTVSARIGQNQPSSAEDAQHPFSVGPVAQHVREYELLVRGLGPLDDGDMATVTHQLLDPGLPCVTDAAQHR